MRFETQIIECFSRHLNKTKLMDYCWTHIRQGCIFFKSPFFFHALYAHFDTFYGLKMGQHAYIALTMPKNHRFPLKKAQKTPNFAIFHLFWVYFFPQTGRGLFFSPNPQQLVFWSIYIPGNGIGKTQIILYWYWYDLPIHYIYIGINK